MKPVQFFKSPQERLLKNVAGILCTTGHAEDRRVKSAFVTADQFPERFRVSRPTRLDQALFVAWTGHHVPLDAPARRKVP